MAAAFVVEKANIEQVTLQRIQAAVAAADAQAQVRAHFQSSAGGCGGGGLQWRRLVHTLGFGLGPSFRLTVLAPPPAPDVLCRWLARSITGLPIS
jgi:hypothetical protein